MCGGKFEGHEAEGGRELRYQKVALSEQHEVD
jgi:hypothetical protein